MTAYYNEFDPQKAAWLRELIKRNLVAPGEVDERSIKDVRASDLVGYTQCHWFAGIGIWSYALRLAGWPDDREVWTGSCPCPGFSCAGKGGGFDDPRHLWPDWYPLISECRPPVIFGEQADDAIGFGWLDLVCGNLEASGYAVAPAVLGAHSAGAPHIRQRLYFCADTAERGYDGRRSGKESTAQQAGERGCTISEPERLRDAGQRAHSDCRGQEAGRLDGQHSERCSRSRESDSSDSATSPELRATGILSDADGRQSRDGNIQRSGEQRLLTEDCGTGEYHNPIGHGRRARRNDDGGDERPVTNTESASLDGGNTAQRRLAMCGSASGNARYASCSSELGVEIDAKFEGLEGHFGDVRDWRGPGWLDPLMARSVAETGATRGYWADCDWWYGRDEKYRPIGPGLFPLASRATARVLRLRGYGDAIVAPVAKIFIQAYLEIEHSTNERKIAT